MDKVFALNVWKRLVEEDRHDEIEKVLSFLEGKEFSVSSSDSQHFHEVRLNILLWELVMVD